MFLNFDFELFGRKKKVPMNKIGCQSNTQFTNFGLRFGSSLYKGHSKRIFFSARIDFSEETSTPELFFYQSSRSRTFTGHKLFILCQI